VRSERHPDRHSSPLQPALSCHPETPRAAAESGGCLGSAGVRVGRADGNAAHQNVVHGPRLACAQQIEQALILVGEQVPEADWLVNEQPQQAVAASNRERETLRMSLEVYRKLPYDAPRPLVALHVNEPGSTGTVRIHQDQSAGRSFGAALV